MENPQLEWLTLKYILPLYKFRLKPTVINGRKAFIALKEAKRYIPVDLMDFIVGDMKKQVEKYELEHNTEVSVSKSSLLKFYLDTRTGTKEEVYTLLAEKWGIETDSVRQIYKRYKSEFDRVDKLFAKAGNSVVYSDPTNDK